MDERVEIWRVLHDGEITAVAGEGGKSLTMFVSIPYLRRRLEPLGDSVVLRLAGVRRFEWRDLSGNPTTLEQELNSTKPEIIGTESDSMPVSIETTMGNLSVDFDSLVLSLDTGEALPYATLREACEEYWADLRSRVEPAAAADERRPGPPPVR